VLGPHLLGFADFKGNRQLLSTGNLDGDDRVALFLMDYPHRERLKILGHARVLDAGEHADLTAQLTPNPELQSKIERLFLIEVVSFDWNCPQYITPRFTAAEIEEQIAPLRARIAELEEELRHAKR
jgi:predicted pyridoxine 5'-phosphate oxidase superfamily flavin-nucleotide-binding protein